MPIDGGSAREGRPHGNARPFVGRNRARGRPTQSLPASRRVVRAHPVRVRLACVVGQDAPDAATRGPAEPLVLSAERVSDGAARWAVPLPVRSRGGPPGDRWAARAAGRLPDRQRLRRAASRSTRSRSMPRATSATPLARRPRSTARGALFRAPEVKMEAYRARRREFACDRRRRGLDILRRSGFIRPARAAAAARPPAPQSLVATDVTIPTSDLAAARAGTRVRGGRAGFASVGSMRPRRRVPTEPRPVPARGARRPKLDPLVQTAPDDPGRSARSGRRRRQPPGTRAGRR